MYLANGDGIPWKRTAAMEAAMYPADVMGANDNGWLRPFLKLIIQIL